MSILNVVHVYEYVSLKIRLDECVQMLHLHQPDGADGYHIEIEDVAMSLTRRAAERPMGRPARRAGGGRARWRDVARDRRGPSRTWAGTRRAWRREVDGREGGSRGCGREEE